VIIGLLDSEEEKGDTGYQVRPKGEKGDEGNISYLDYKGEVETLALLNGEKGGVGCTGFK